MNRDEQASVLILGGDGEFGQFLIHQILPGLSVSDISIIERETPRERHASLLEHARHVVLATPLAGYAERACELIYQCRHLKAPTTLWLIPSVQAGVYRAASATLELVANPKLSAVFIHPMYGPNGFRETEAEARTFQNVLTSAYSGAEHPLAKEVDEITTLFLERFNITTTTRFDPDEHDRVTAYSQGLSYCVGRLMFEHPGLDQMIQTEMADLHHSFTANHDLILDFVEVNSYMPQVLAAFADAWRQTNQKFFKDVLQAFGHADTALNRGDDSPISTKWYEQLRSAARGVTSSEKARGARDGIEPGA